MLQRALAALFFVSGLYYLSFFLVRQQAFTIVQATTLLCAATLLVLQERPRMAWQPVKWQGWVALSVGMVLALGVFLAVDRNSHSVSDTLIGVLPTFSLLTAVGMKLLYQRGGL